MRLASEFDDELPKSSVIQNPGTFRAKDLVGRSLDSLTIWCGTFVKLIAEGGLGEFICSSTNLRIPAAVDPIAVGVPVGISKPRCIVELFGEVLETS